MPKLRLIDPQNPFNARVQGDVARRVPFGRKAIFMRVGLRVATGWILTLVSSGCGLLGHLLGGGPAEDTRRRFGATNASPAINSAELDELTRAFADRYVGLLHSTCDALKKDNTDLVQRREAQLLLTDCATNVYDIASNPDAFTRMLDLVVVATLVSQVWIDDNRVEEVFAGREEMLVRALHHGRVEAWDLAAQVLRPEQLDLLDYLLWDWRRHNTDMVRASFVRFSTFAIGRGKSAATTVDAAHWFSLVEILGVGDLFSSFGETGQAVDEARLVTERMFYLLKRGPTVLRWQVEALQDGMLATPEVGKALANVHRLTDQVEQLPKNVAVERQATLAALDDRMDRADVTVANMRAALSDANGLVTSLGPTSKSLNEMLETADALVARFDSPDGGAATQPSRPFDIREYVEAVKELAVTAGKMNDLLISSNELLGSSEWDRRIQQVSQSPDGRMKVAAEQSQLYGIFCRTPRRGGSSIERWGQVGLTQDWTDRPIILYGYDREDGAHQIFEQRVLEGGAFRLSLRVQGGGSSIAQGVAAVPGSIGFASVFFTCQRVRAVPIAGTDGAFYGPTADNVRSLRYPLSLHLREQTAASTVRWSGGGVLAIFPLARGAANRCRRRQHPSRYGDREGMRAPAGGVNRLLMDPWSDRTSAP